MKTLECICKLLSDHEDWEEPWEGMDDACEEYKRKMQAVESLKNYQGTEALFNTRIKVCPACGTLYLWDYYLWHFGDRDGLRLDRFSPEQTEVLKPLLDSGDEAVLSSSFERAFTHTDKRFAELAETIYYYYIRWNTYRPAVMTALAGLTTHKNPDARRMASNLLISIASDGKSAEISKAIEGKELDTNDEHIKRLLQKLNEKKKPG